MLCCQMLQDWLRHANQSLARLADVKKTSYRLGGGPREREVNCQCNYRSKNNSSFVSLNPEPPQLELESQETARYTMLASVCFNVQPSVPSHSLKITTVPFNNNKHRL